MLVKTEVARKARHSRALKAIFRCQCRQSYAALERALAAARCPWFGVNLDPVSILRDSLNIDEIFARLGPSIRHVRARDAVVGADKRTKPASVGRGDTKWDHLLSNLEGSGYHGWITFDPTELADRSAAAISGLK